MSEQSEMSNKNKSFCCYFNFFKRQNFKMSPIFHFSRTLIFVYVLTSEKLFPMNEKINNPSKMAKMQFY